MKWNLGGIYKTDNFINDIAFRTSLFVFFDLNTYFHFLFAINFSHSPVIFTNGKGVPLKYFHFYMKITDIWDILNVLLMTIYPNYSSI